MCDVSASQCTPLHCCVVHRSKCGGCRIGLGGEVKVDSKRPLHHGLIQGNSMRAAGYDSPTQPEGSQTAQQGRKPYPNPLGTTTTTGQ